MSRRALRSTGSLRLGSPDSSLLRRAPTPRHPSRRASLPSLGGTAAIQRPEVARSPKFLGNPRHTCPGSPTPAEPRELASGTSPYVALLRHRLPGPWTRRLPATPYFGVQFRGLHARCLRFVVTVARLPLYDHARLASGWGLSLGRTGVQPAGSLQSVSAIDGLTWLPPLRGFLAHQGQGYGEPRNCQTSNASPAKPAKPGGLPKD
jgi:hypothetical protein